MGPLMLDLSGLEVTPEEKEILEHPLVGGVIYFTRNFYDIAQIQELVRVTRQSSKDPLLLAVDHEGGRVQRFRKGFSSIPAMRHILPKCENDLERAATVSENLGWIMASEVLATGIDISFAPVLDVDGISEVIGDRGFSDRADVVTRLSSAFARGMQSAGMKTTGKHFPGHGNVKEDSHIALPIDNRPKNEVLSLDASVFKSLNTDGLLDAVMPAHVIYSDADDKPAGFSNYWLQTVLRKNMGFEGVIFSDDLSMEGAVHLGEPWQRAELAMDAGCDMVLVCNNREAAINVIDHIDQNRQFSQRTLNMLSNAAVPQSFDKMRASSAWQSAHKSLEVFDAQ